MKKLLFILSSALILCSCECQDSSYQIEVTFINGDKDTFLIKKTSCQSEQDVFFNNSCIYKFHRETKYDANFTGCVTCGVRKYRKLNKD